MSLELTSEDENVLNYLGGSVEGIVVKVRQTRESLQCHLDVLNLCLIDSAISDKGACSTVGVGLLVKLPVICIGRGCCKGRTLLIK